MGESGLVKIDPYGDRTDFQLEIRKLDHEEHTLQGTWSANTGLMWSRKQAKVRQSNFDAGRPLVITTVLVFFILISYRVFGQMFCSRVNLMPC